MKNKKNKPIDTNGFSQVPNYILEALAHDNSIEKVHYRILLLIIRLTYGIKPHGYSFEWVDIETNEFITANIETQHLKRSLEYLIDKEILLFEEPRYYSLNTNYFYDYLLKNRRDLYLLKHNRLLILNINKLKTDHHNSDIELHERYEDFNNRFGRIIDRDEWV